MKKYAISLRSSTVVLMRGLPGSGKSTWLRNNNCEDYVISPDTFRLLLSPPIETTRDGEFTYEINQNVSRRAWELTHECLRSRLSCKVGNAVGATFIDATFMSDRAVRDIKRIVLEETQGRAIVVILDFTFLPIEEVKRRNKMRLGTYRYVPEMVIDHMAEMGAKMDVNSYGVRVLDPREVQITI